MTSNSHMTIPLLGEFPDHQGFEALERATVSTVHHPANVVCTFPDAAVVCSEFPDAATNHYCMSHYIAVNFLITEALERYHFYYGDELKVECPTGSGNMLTLLQVSQEICHRIASIFVADDTGKRPCHGNDHRYADDPHWKNLVLFYEYFNGDTGKGCGAR